MDARVCVTCGNKNPVNITNNRLVTESCGHVKCMQCLMQEKSGCIACKARADGEKDLESSILPKDNLTEEYKTLQTNMPMLLKEVTKGSQEVEFTEEPIKNKLDISHIKILEEGSPKRYKCMVCKRLFNARSQVAYHAYCNSDQQSPYQCPQAECKNKTFASRSHFEYHMLVHRKERRHVCEVCGDSFFLKSKLQRHKLKHTKEKKHSCGDCGKAFNNMTALRKHARTHTGERPYVCQCGVSFRDSSNYQKHLARHEVASKKSVGGVCRRAGRDFQCARCPQAFRSRKDMRRHAQVHTDEKPFACELCIPERRFRRKDNLNRHYHNTHTDVTPPTHPTVPATQHMQQNGKSTQYEEPKKTEEICDKAKLEVLNPLPPLPEEVIQKHLYTEPQTNTEREIDKLYIMEANTARESVIVRKCLEKKIPSPVTEYVHKIRKANSLSCQKDMSLPPIDENKFLELEKKNRLNNLDVGPLPKNIQPYKNILHEKADKQNEEDKVPKVHWRKQRLNDNE